MYGNDSVHNNSYVTMTLPSLTAHHITDTCNDVRREARAFEDSRAKRVLGRSYLVSHIVMFETSSLMIR
ncbi:hypothetical protein DPMN_010376 [Dreissena polymorpha]|uniref:Uncharacterized protein n=1 Tax=Dreissena polymorpha TaxID=45954 RepID=A0A9D4N1E6_DREPO|nr:hypothetical protein DPMN_010376 [Dreissena polymorpha]